MRAPELRPGSVSPWWYGAAGLLTAWCVALYLALSPSAPPPEAAADAQARDFVVGLRQLAATWTMQMAIQQALGRSAQPFEAQADSMGQLAESLLDDGPHTSDAQAMVAAMLLAFGAPKQARSIRERIHHEDVALVRALDALLTEPPRAGPADVALFEEAGLPRRAVARLRLLVLDEGPARDAVTRWIERDNRALLVRLGGLELGAALLTLVGLLCLLALRVVANQFRRRFGGVSPPAPFAVPGIRLYVAAMGWLAVSLGAGGALGAWVAAQGGGSRAQTLAILLDVFVTGLAGFGAAALCRTPGMPLGAAVGLAWAQVRGRLRALAAAVVAGWSMALPVTFALSIVTVLVTSRQPLVTNPVIPLLANAPSPGIAAAVAAVTVLAAPFFEEIFFRGFLYRALRDHARPLEAMLLTSALFAAVHPSPFTILPLFGFGVLLAWLYEVTGSVWPGIAVHALFNAGTLAWVAVSLREPPWMG